MGPLSRAETRLVQLQPHPLTANKNFEWEDGYKLYENTKASTLAEQLLGETALRSNIALLNNFGAVSGSRSAIEAGTVRSGPDRQGQGADGDVQGLPRRARDLQHEDEAQGPRLRQRQEGKR